MKRFFLLPFCLLLFIAFVSDENRGIQHFGVDEGLSQGTAFSMVQDDKGFIWIATPDGLNRFDGYTFKVFKNDPADSLSFRHNGFRNLYKGKRNLWVTLDRTKDLYRINLITQQIQKAHFSPSQQVPGHLLPFKEDADTLWVLVDDFGIAKLNATTGTLLQQFPLPINCSATHNPANFDSASSTLFYISDKALEFCSFFLRTHAFTQHTINDAKTNHPLFLFSIFSGNGNSLWLGASNELIEYDKTTQVFSHYTLPHELTAPISEDICTMLEIGDQVWCGTSIGSIYRFDEKKKTFTLQSRPSDRNSGYKTRAITFVLDKTKNLWVGTDPDGLYKIDTKKKPFQHTFRADENTTGLKSNFIKSFLQVGNEIFVGTLDQGINVFNRTNNTFRYINGPGNSTFNIPAIFSMATDSSSHLLVATEHGLFTVENGKSYLTKLNLQNPENVLPSNATTICTLSDQSFLVGHFDGVYHLTREGDFYRYEKLPIADYIQKITEDRKGNVWICAIGGIYFAEKNAGLHSLKLVRNDIGTVRCLYEDAEGMMWAGSTSGLHKINPQTKAVVKNYSEKDGMPNNYVYGILSDGSGYFWISTNKGITKFNPATEKFRNYTVADGLQSNEFNTGAFYKTSDGELFFGGVHGFNHFYPNEIRDNPFPPASIITSLKVFDKYFATDSSIEYKKHLTLDYMNNNLLLEYAAMEFSDVSNNHFSYRLLGLDSNWVNADKAHFARFVNLRPGEYVFQLKAANNDGIWNEQPTELHITITPPFWQTLPFIISIVVAGLLLAFLGIRFYFRREVKIQTRELQLEQSVRMNAIIETEEKERKRIAGELHDGLGQLLSTARLNIAGFEDMRDGKDQLLLKNSLQLLDEACAEVRTISHNMMPGALIRLGLVEALNELANKINDSGQIKVVYHTELEERFAENVEIALYRIIQEVLNNMVRHAEAKNISIKLEKRQNKLEITLTDDGKSFDVSTIQHSDGLGWKNIHSRVELLNGSIDIASEKGKGTTIFIRIPLH